MLTKKRSHNFSAIRQEPLLWWEKQKLKYVYTKIKAKHRTTILLDTQTQWKDKKNKNKTQSYQQCKQTKSIKIQMLHFRNLGGIPLWTFLSNKSLKREDNSCSLER